MQGLTLKSQLQWNLTGYVNECNRHLHISQDRHEIFLTFAEYGESYLKYLKEGLSPGDPEPFLTLHEFGPWDIKDARHMQELGPIILAFTMRAHEDQQLESRSSAGQGRTESRRKDSSHGTIPGLKRQFGGIGW